jgi:hypothetical protein
MEDRVGDRRSCADIAKLANALDAGGIHPIVFFRDENDLSATSAFTAMR